MSFFCCFKNKNESKGMTKENSKENENTTQNGAQIDPKTFQLIKETERVLNSNKAFLSIAKLHFQDPYQEMTQEGAPFAKMMHDVDPEAFVHHIMEGLWLMKPPKLVLFIISNASRVSKWKNEKQMMKFQKGIMKAGESTNMCIFMNACNGGVTSSIGDALRDKMIEIKTSRKLLKSKSDVRVIGMAREDMLRYSIGTSQQSHDKENGAEESDNKEKDSEESSIKQSDAEENNAKTEPKLLKRYDVKVINDRELLKEENKYELNSNLTNYIIVRDKTTEKTGVNQFITGLANFYSKSGDKQNNEPSPNDVCTLRHTEIPVVSILIEGGCDSVLIVHDLIKNEIPVVVLDGTGGLANLLAFIYYEFENRRINKWNKSFVESFLGPELIAKIRVEFPDMNLIDDSDGEIDAETDDKTHDDANVKIREKVNEFFRNILRCFRLSMESRHTYLTVLNISNLISYDMENITEFLLMALFRSQKTKIPKTKRSLHLDPKELNPEIVTHDREILTKDWNLCIDWNCPEIAKKEVLAKDPFRIILEKSLFKKALERSKRPEFVDLLLSHGMRLRTFINPKRLLKLYQKIQYHEFFRTVCWEGILNRASDAKLKNTFLERELNWLIEAVTGIRGFIDTEELDLFVMAQWPKSEAEAERKSLEILIMWAVFDFRREHVKVLWKHSDQPIHLALIISHMYESLSKFVAEQTLHNELMTESITFKQFAYDVLEECNKESPERAEDVLNEVSSDWNYKTAVDIATSAKCIKFISHTCCQKWITLSFYGNISFRELRRGIYVPTFIKIILCALFIFPMYFWVRFTRTGKPEEPEDTEFDVDEDDDPVEGDAGKPKELQRKMSYREFPRQIKKYGHTIIDDREMIIKNQPPLWKMIHIYWNAPITKFWTFQFFYVIYLAIFSVAVLYPGCGNFYVDFGVCIWTGLITVDLIRRTYLFSKNYPSEPIKYKVLEITLLILFLTVYIYGRLLDEQFSFISPYHEKVILCFGLLYSFYRLNAIYLPISPTLGPLWYRLKVMVMLDFLTFIRMALLVMISSGIAIQAVLYPDKPFGNDIFQQTFHRSFIALFTTPLDEILTECQYPNSNSTDNYEPECHAGEHFNSACPNTGFWPYAFVLSYFVLLKLILLTLLYAIFASSAARLASDTDNIWKFQRYILVADFKDRLPLPPPLNVFCYIYIAIKWIYRMLTCQCCMKKATKSEILLVGDSNEKRHVKLLGEGDYNYLKGCAANCILKEQEKIHDEQIYRKQWELIRYHSQEFEYQKQLLRQLRGKTSELERLLKNPAKINAKEEKKANDKTFTP